MCNLRLSLIVPPETYIYGYLFAISAFIAAVVNTIALIVLWMPQHRSKSNRILTSLVISDMLTGYVLFPLNSYEVLGTKSNMMCTIDIVRAFLAVFLAGSSVLTLGFISFERYILLTKYGRYDKIITRRNITFVLMFSWLFPGLTPFIRYVHEIPYLFILILIFYGPFIALLVFYYLLARVIQQNQRNLQSHGNRPLSRIADNEFSSTFPSTGDECTSSCCNVSEGNRISKVRTETLEIAGLKHPRSKSVSLTTINAIKSKKREKRRIKIAKSISILIACYFFCLTPLNIWLVLDIANMYKKFMSPLKLQQLYLFAIFSGSFNSCINPFIYIWKQPGFRKNVEKLLCPSKHQAASTGQK